MKYFSYIIIAIVMTAIITGFFFVESPSQVRLLRLDEQRVNDLQNIQWEIVGYWQTKNKLPENLSQLDDNIKGYTAPHDPVTNSDYNYQVKNKLSFELCATFNLEANQDNSLKSMPVYRETGYDLGNWQHAAGLYCFTRTIDPEIYKLNNKSVN